MEGTRVILVTSIIKDLHVFWINSILNVELTITIGIPIRHNTFGFFVNIFTGPSSITFWAFIRIVTVKISGFWTVFISPSIFTHNNAIVDFTGIKRSIVVEITVIK
jgi:hypothetical protein